MGVQATPYQPAHMRHLRRGVYSATLCPLGGWARPGDSLVQGVNPFAKISEILNQLIRMRNNVTAQSLNPSVPHSPT